nr:hypothetical protein [Tanacetum cinerariifolium]
TGRALIDMLEGELTLRVGKEDITFNLDQTSRYSANYNDMTAKRIDVIDMACEEYSQEVFGFSNVIGSGNPTPYYDPIVFTSSSPKVDHSYLDPEGDILLLEAFLNDDPSLPPPNQGNYFPEVRKELKISCEEYVQEVLGFSDNSKSSNPTPISDPIIALSSPSLTPFEGGDFILEEIEACLTSESIPPRIDDTYLDLEGEIHLLEELSNNDPSLSPLPQKELN